MIQGKHCTFFLTELCETGSHFAVHTLCCRPEDKYCPTADSWKFKFVETADQCPEIGSWPASNLPQNERYNISFGATLTTFNTFLSHLREDGSAPWPRIYLLVRDADFMRG